MTRIWQVYQQKKLSPTGLVDLRHLPNLHIFAIYVLIRCDAQELVVLRDINNLILRTIPNANQVTNWHFVSTSTVFILLMDAWTRLGRIVWLGYTCFCRETSQAFELYVELSMVPPFDPPPVGDELYERIKEKIAYLSDYPNICTHVWYTSLLFCIPCQWSHSCNVPFERDATLQILRNG